MPANGGLSQQQAKEVVIGLIGKGSTVARAMAAVGRSVKTFESWRSADKDFARKIDEARVNRVKAQADKRDPEVKNLSFEEWRKRFLGRDTYPHMRTWIDLLEGREPTDLHPSIKYKPGSSRRIIVTTPPHHAKSSVISQEYVTYRICMNPNIRVIIISKTREKAKELLHSVQTMLTSPEYQRLQAAYAPSVEGFKDTTQPWTANKIYVAGREGAERSPTVEALGIGGQIYGSRADLIILDDPVDFHNAGDHAKHVQWMNQEVSSRTQNGKIIAVGTRVASQDLYSELLNGENYLRKVSPWTHISQPAVLELDDDPEKWVTLWPRSNTPLSQDDPGPQGEDGLYAAWDGPALDLRRNDVLPRVWALVYQQQEVADDGVFNPTAVSASVNGMRKPGLLKPGAMGHPRAGMEGQYIIGSMDPAMTGDTFTLIGAVDRKDMKRRILQAWVKTSPSPAYIRDLIKTTTTEYGVHEWVIEQNAFQLFLIHDEELQDYCRQRGVKITPHFTGRNKQDPEFGVASCAPLFGSIRRIVEGAGREVHNKDNLIELPDTNYSEGVRALVEQLITWIPGKLGRQLKQDGPMALWFFELRAREILGMGRRRQQHFVPNPYLSRGDQAARVVIPMSSYTAQAG